MMAETNGEKKSVLFVDDDKFLADMYGLKFTNGGFTVQACLSVADALEALRSGFQADAIVFDLVMPERDGFSFLQALRDEKLAPQAVRIALTNQSDDSEKKKAEELGVDRYVVKASMIPSEVVALVAQEIGARKKK
ncbi:MAG: response regulator [Candidatus Kaiserbacteria bacterium]|nr:MAG: response regulator [Candidatus Kaiserbacteria bacterium]